MFRVRIRVRYTTRESKFWQYLVELDCLCGQQFKLPAILDSVGRVSRVFGLILIPMGQVLEQKDVLSSYVGYVEVECGLTSLSTIVLGPICTAD